MLERWLLTIKGLHAREVLLPAHVLAVDLAEIAHEKGIFVTGLAGLVVDALYALAEGIANQLLRKDCAMMIDLMIKVQLLVDENRIVFELNWCVGVQGSCCHYHIP